MSRQKGNTSEKRRGIGILKVLLTQKVIGILCILVVITILGLGVSRHFFTDSKTEKIGFENIGELATQSAYTTEIQVTEASRELFGVSIPFTQSKYIYSYDVVIKAGFDFNEIEWKLTDHKIEVKLPEAKVLSSEIDLDSFRVYHEEESIFRKVTLEENNEALKSMQENAEKDAVANGLLENARTNAETILTAFFAGTYNPDEYEIIFQ